MGRRVHAAPDADTRRKARERYEQGATLKNVSEEFGGYPVLWQKIARREGWRGREPIVLLPHGPGVSRGRRIVPGTGSTGKELTEELRSEGFTYLEIADMLEEKQGTVRAWVRAPAPGNHTGWPGERVLPDTGLTARQYAVKLRGEGRSYREIGEVLGVSHEAVRLWIKRAKGD